MTANTWPRCHTLPYCTDASHYFAKLRDLAWPVWLDSGQPQAPQGRYDILAADPIEHITLPATAAASLPNLLRAALPAHFCNPGTLPFSGGWIGYLSYATGCAWLGQPNNHQPRLAPDIQIGLYDWAVVIDHQQQIATLVGAGQALSTRTHWDALCDLAQPVATLPPLTPYTGRLLENSLPKTAYTQAFQRIQHYLQAGDSYQINLTRRFSAHTTEDSWSLYRRLRQLSPAPYGAYLAFPEATICCNSPEQFLQKTADQVCTRPIKGTRARGMTPAEDAQLQAALRNSGKDQAENLMIVDLLRNDLGRVCQPGSIQVPALFQLESYAKVHHLVSTIHGRLQPNKDAIDLLQACLPGGSITGAPKKRAVQIIAELEPVNREMYCGTIFWLGLDGNLDSNISIRTVLHQNNTLYYWAGGGIVADSEADAEYQESLDKAAAFLALL